MRILAIISKKIKDYKRVPRNDVNNEGRNNDEENGQPLTTLIILLMLICCLTWTLTSWIAFEKPLCDSCPDIPDSLRFDCHPEEGVNKERCEGRGCCWRPPKAENALPLDIPYCYYPDDYSLYNLTNSSRSEDQETHNFMISNWSFFPKDVRNLRLEVTCFDKAILRVRIKDANEQRYEVPFTNFNGQKQKLDECDLKFRLSESSQLKFQVLRKSTGAVLFDTTEAGAFIFSDQFLQISSILPSKFIYGLGEHRKPFLKDVNWKQLSFWNADQWPSDTSTNLYGSHPFFINMDAESNQGFGMFWLNSNAMEAVLQPTPAITLRSLGGIFDLFFISGPKPMEIVQQYTKIVGKPFLPPFWSLGYHQCKFEYGSVERTRQVLEQTQKAGIPIDVQWNDIDYMDDRKDFTFNSKKFKGLPQFVEELHEKGLHYVPIIDPGISSTEKKGSYRPYDLGITMDVFIKNSSGHPFNGRVWTNGETVWPDFTDPNAWTYWSLMMQEFHDKVAIDGAWIDMNEPSNFYDGQKHGCENHPFNHPPYTPRSIDGQKVFHKTICPSAQQHLGPHYNLHNMYGYSEAIATNKALKAIRKKRPFIISRSTFPGHGHFAGHWTGDVLSDWSSLHDSLSGVMNFNLFGIPMVGADICGFNGNTTAKLCQRWMELGAFYPFSRNHNTDNGIDQDPVSLGPEVVKAAKEALEVRYSLLPYLYTLFVKAHLFGDPVVTPTFFHAQKGDEMAYFVEEQMLWGSDLLIVPVLQEDKEETEAYLPNGIWYDLRSMKRLEADIPGFITLPAPLHIIPLLAKGGSIFARHGLGLAKTTTQSQKLPLEVHVFLSEEETAKGELYWDDGDSLNTYEKGQFSHVLFQCDSNGLQMQSKNNASLLPLPKLETVIIAGMNRKVKLVQLNGQNVPFLYDEVKKVLKIVELNAKMTQNIKITWQ